jgi:hypothetical protein
VVVVEKKTEPARPRTLDEAHHALASIRPRLDASPQEWLAYYQRSTGMYAEIAEIDRAHHHEALSFAERERDSAQKIKDQVANNHGEDYDLGISDDIDTGP